MNPSATRSLSDSLSGDPTANSEVLAKKRKIDEDITTLFEDFGTVMDDYEETEYGEEDYEEEEDVDFEEDYYCSDLECSSSSEDGSDCCAMCNGDFPIEESQDEEDEDGIDEGDDYDQDDDEEETNHDEDNEKIEKSEAKVDEKLDKMRDGEGAAKAVEDEGGEPNRDAVAEPAWHPLFRLDAPRVVLLSNDNQKLCVYRHTLCSHSDVFKDMFSLPASDLNMDQAQPIFIDEKADVLALMISDLQQHESRTGPSSSKDHGLAINHSVLKAHDKYQVSDGRRAAERRLKRDLEVDPFAGFAYASWNADLDLGRQAIGLMNLLDGCDGDRVDFWEKISDAKPSWQLALAQLAMPSMSRRYYHSRGGKKVSYLQVMVNSDLRSKAATFSPKDWKRGVKGDGK